MSDTPHDPSPEPAPAASPTPETVTAPVFAPTGLPPKPASPPPSNPLAKFPSAVRAAQAHFLATGDVNSLDSVVLAVVLDHQPSVARKPEAEPPADSARLIEDLGFDSLALAEIVFFLEDLYKLTITNEELKNVTTMGEIRAFVRAKVAEAAQPPTAPASPTAPESPKVGDTTSA
ncbi:MAG: Acyl carrier protein [Verrucomicrobia bacterium]|nr:MAG: Acyl carrier protein [Verrucomicrobiota bacterium]